MLLTRLPPLAVPIIPPQGSKFRAAVGLPADYDFEELEFATACNVELHEAVLFGKPTSAPSGGAGLWDVPPEQSVEGLLTAALVELGWSQFLREEDGGVSGSKHGKEAGPYTFTQMHAWIGAGHLGPERLVRPFSEPGAWRRRSSESNARLRALS